MFLNLINVNNNTSKLDKGAVTFQFSSKIYVRNSLFLNNKAQNAEGAISIKKCEEIHINRTEISYNWVNDGSAGIYILECKTVILSINAYYKNIN